MTDKEFEVLDELYFVTSFKALKASLGWSSDEVIQPLGQMIEKAWVKCIDPVTEQEVPCSTKAQLDEIIEQVLFLATKKGLMEHNSK